MPRNENEYTDVVELGKIAKSFDGFDYSILVQSDRLDEITDFSEILSKNKLYQEERIFLHEWSRHFARLENCGGRYKSLIERARKKGAL